MNRLCVLLVGAIVLFAGQSRADAVIDWNATAITVMLKVPSLARNPLTDLVYVHIAIYDAVNAIDGRYSVFAVAPSNAVAWASMQAATAAAARRVLLTFYASQQPYIDSVYAAALALLPNDSTKTRGVAIGDTVATRFLALRAGDGRDAISTYTWSTPGAGVYQPTPPGAAQYQPLNPWVAQLRPFSLNSPSQFRAPGPPSLTSDVYTRDFNEVKRYGSRDSSLTTAQQREMARFHTENPNVQLSRNIRLFAQARGMSLADNARLFAQLYVTIGDALITGWDSKYLYLNWRPATAIREAAIDGNPLTASDTSWLALVTTPTHPEYVAAHGCALGALAYTLEKFFGTSNVPVTLTSTVTGTLHFFTNINEIVTESINARVYGGMHFRSSVEDGAAIGRSVATWVARHHFIRLNASPWAVQQAPGLLTSLNPDVALSAVNDNVCWGVKTTNSQFVRTINGGTTWSSSVVGGTAGLVCSNIAAIDANTAWVVMEDPTSITSGEILKTTDGGIGWVKEATVPQVPPTQHGAVPLRGIHFFNSNDGVVFGGLRAGDHSWDIYTTTDGGARWIPVPTANIPPPQVTWEEFRVGGNYASTGNSLWFGTFSRSLYRTTNKGATWTAARNVLGSDGVGLFIAFKDSLIGLGCSPFNNLGGNRISRTTDGGTTWTPLGAASVPSTPTVNSIAYVPGTRAYVIASGSNIGFPEATIPGSTYSVDDGSSWTQIDNLPHGLATFASSRVGWSDGTNDVLYKWDSNLFPTSARQTKSTAESFRLEQNYPNPFNPSTTIRYELPIASHVRLSIFNTLGQEVATLVDAVEEPGFKSVQWNATGVASGVYLYRIQASNSSGQAGTYVATNKLLLLK